MKTIITPVKIKGFNNIIVDLKRKTVTDLLNRLPDIKVKNLSGYSVGGAIVLILAQKLNLNSITIFSPTPYFKERLNTFPKYIIKALGKKRITDINKYSVKNINRNIKTKIIIGEDEVRDVKSFAKYLNKTIKNSSLIIKEGCNHNDLLK